MSVLDKVLPVLATLYFLSAAAATAVDVGRENLTPSSNQETPRALLNPADEATGRAKNIIHLLTKRKGQHSNIVSNIHSYCVVY